MEHPKEGLGEGGGIPRTRDSDGMPYLQATGCNMQRILCLARSSVVLCISHLTMVMGRLLGEFVDRVAREVAPLVR